MAEKPRANSNIEDAIGINIKGDFNLRDTSGSWRNAEILKQFLDLGNPGGAANQHDVMHLGFIQLGVPQRLLHWVQRAAEQVGVQLFEARPGDGRVEVDALVEGVDLDAGLSAGGQGALGSLTGSAQAPDCPLVLADVLLVLALELGDEMVDHAVVEVFAPQVGVSRR
ncbi:hypothetical protein L345_08355, partial [Ophiophagus hannah]